MEPETVREALRRVVAVFERRPESARHVDSVATASWSHGLQTDVAHPNGTVLITDMPGEYGGAGLGVTPGWLMRAGAASCTATCIVMAAVQRGIHLDSIEVMVESTSDARGNLGMQDQHGRQVDAAPSDFKMHVRISAKGQTDGALRELVAIGVGSSSVVRALECEVPVTLLINSQR